jgi:cell division protease FtsH
VTFTDVAGCDEAKRELGQMVEFLKNPSRFTALGGRIPKGVLLLGPPGTGKTLLARAIAGEAGVPFFSLSGSDFVEMFVGVGAARVRDLFEQAKSRAPCIVFVDEVDAIGRQRGVSMGVVNDEREQTLNQLLAEMDGFENNAGVILLAATNRPEILDKALLRPGRFDRQVVLDAPDLVGREAILRVHVRGKPLAKDVDLKGVARVTPGMAGADLANVVNEAALLAADRHRASIAQQDLLEAVERVVAGPERRSRRLEPDEKRRVAYHESGHALVAARVEHPEPVQKVTIVPRGRAALGYTMQLPEQEHYLRTREELLDRLTVLMGGRAAEELVFGDVSTGAEDDLRAATDLTRRMVCTLGMSERIGLAHCARQAEGVYLGGEGPLVRDCSEQTLREIDQEVRSILETAREHAGALLEAERELLECIAAELLEKETLDRAGFERLAGRDRS